jgi:hypothetical protein
LRIAEPFFLLNKKDNLADAAKNYYLLKRVRAWLKRASAEVFKAIVQGFFKQGEKNQIFYCND